MRVFPIFHRGVPVRPTGLLVLLLVPLIAGCVVSLAPAYHEADLVFDPEIVGTWRVGEGEETLAFERAGERSYRVVHTGEEGQASVLDGHLARLDGTLVLDLVPDDVGADLPDFLVLHLLPAHSALRVTRVEDRMRLQFLDSEWLQEKLESGERSADHRIVDNRVVLTGTTDEVRDLVAALAAVDDAWEKGEVFHRAR